MSAMVASASFVISWLVSERRPGGGVGKGKSNRLIRRDEID